MRTKNILFLLLIISAITRISWYHFPFFTPEEAMVAYRGFTLATLGKDELGRFLPFIFNSLTDYQLPLVSYLTAFGELIFGKTELGARIIFMVLGSLLPVLIYMITQKITGKAKIALIACIITIFSPALIFISRIPNPIIIMVILFSSLFYILVREKINIQIYSLIVILLLLTSKTTWFILIPFIFATVFLFNRNLEFKSKRLVFAVSSILLLVVIMCYLQIPQAKRSLSENYFSLFSDITITNGINKLRGQGLDSGTPSFLARIFFSKIHFLLAGAVNWISQLNVASYFGNNLSLYNFSLIGILPKILIIPMFLGLIYVIKNEKRFLVLPVIMTFPAIFMKIQILSELIFLTLPFVILIVALGFNSLNKKIVKAVIILMIAEVGLNFLNLNGEYKYHNNDRPVWVREIINQINSSKGRNIWISDNITEPDFTSYLEWMTNFDPPKAFEDVGFPYRFRQYNVDRYKIIGSDIKLKSCEINSKYETIVSKRDLDKTERKNNLHEKVFKDSLGNDAVFLQLNICPE